MSNEIRMTCAVCVARPAFGFEDRVDVGERRCGRSGRTVFALRLRSLAAPGDGEQRGEAKRESESADSQLGHNTVRPNRRSACGSASLSTISPTTMSSTPVTSLTVPM